MIYIFIVGMLILAAWFLMVWIRKTMWDAVHRNMIDLEDKIDGKVMRSGFASRPYFHGKYNGFDLTINFSSEKTSGKRLTYVDISYSIPCKLSFTLSDKEWLEAQQAGPLEDFIEWQNMHKKALVLRPASDKDVKKLFSESAFKELMDDQNDLAYIFLGKTGLIYEFITEEVIKSTEVEPLLKRLEFLDKLNKVVN